MSRTEARVSPAYRPRRGRQPRTGAVHCRRCEEPVPELGSPLTRETPMAITIRTDDEDGEGLQLISTYRVTWLVALLRTLTTDGEGTAVISWLSTKSRSLSPLTR